MPVTQVHLSKQIHTCACMCVHTCVSLCLDSLKDKTAGVPYRYRPTGNRKSALPDRKSARADRKSARPDRKSALPDRKSAGQASPAAPERGPGRSPRWPPTASLRSCWKWPGSCSSGGPGWKRGEEHTGEPEEERGWGGREVMSRRLTWSSWSALDCRDSHSSLRCTRPEGASFRVNH